MLRSTGHETVEHLYISQNKIGTSPDNRKESPRKKEKGSKEDETKKQ